MATTVVLDEAGIESIFSPAGPAARFVGDLGRKVFENAYLRAPVGAPSKTADGHPSGYLRSQMGWYFAGDLSVRISTSATLSKATHRPGDPYARWIERPQERPWAPPPFARADRPYLVPALDEIMGALG